jgi:RHS repeat-associated protein
VNCPAAENIMAKSDFGSPYAYGNKYRPSGAGPHAVLTVGSPTIWSYQYDPNGNMTGDGQRTIDYDDQDRPNKITLGGVTTVFKYSPDGERYLQRTISSDTSINRTIYYVDKLYERVDWDSKPNEERTYCGPSVVIEQKGATREVRYLHLDRLGSTDAATGDGGIELVDDAHGFDAFGRPRGRDWQPSADQMHPNGEWGTATNHGFTGHEQLDETFLTHMNGRVYDYRLGRFLSVDPVIGNPANSQSINPYSYIGNNPLSGVDPSGYMAIGDGIEGESCDLGPCQRKFGPIPVLEVNGNSAPATTAANTSSSPSNTKSPTDVALGDVGLPSDGVTTLVEDALANAAKSPQTAGGVLARLGSAAPYLLPIIVGGLQIYLYKTHPDWQFIDPESPSSSMLVLKSSGTEMLLPGVETPAQPGQAVGDAPKANEKGGALSRGPGIPDLHLGSTPLTSDLAPSTLYHYTNEAGLAGILNSGYLNASTKAANPNDVRYGNGQYLSDIAPGTKTPGELSAKFLGFPFQARRFTHFVEIDVRGLSILQGRLGVYVIPNEMPLDISGRITNSGCSP